MNKKGNLFLAFVFAGFFFMMGMLMLPFMKDSISDSRTSLQCTNSSISDGGKLTCLTTDVGVPLFIIVILTFAGGLIGNNL